MTRLIGILGGTFDPVHHGHMHMAQALITQYAFDEIRFLPCHIPAHRENPATRIHDRIEMLHLALEQLPYCHVDLLEINRGGVSYMADTLKDLKTIYPSDHLVFMLGMDAYNHLNTWHRWPTLLNHANMVVMPRPGHTRGCQSWQQAYCAEHETSDITDLRTHQAGQLFFAQTPERNVSATEIRKHIHAHTVTPEEVPTPVWQYIQDKKLYLQT